VRAPLQLLCGEFDARCPIRDSIEAARDLEQMGKVVDFVLYKGEGHTFLKTENVLDAEQRRIDFLSRYLEQE
jgi:dipeptidyl aminopeptidase/acylaminoacyl peptidase